MNIGLRQSCGVATLCLSLLRAGPSAAEQSTITLAELTARTQALYAAIAPGDRAPWRIYLAEDAVFVDETGHIMDKRQFLDELHPLPQGYSGHIQVASPILKQSGTVAVLSYDLDEQETIFGQQEVARYHVTDTWLLRSGQWQILASQTLRYYEDPAATIVPAATLTEYTGTYQLSPENMIHVFVQKGSLMANRNGGEPYELVPETSSLFFRPGVEGRRLFHRNASGQVDSMIDRRNNEDVIWKKLL